MPGGEGRKWHSRHIAFYGVAEHTITRYTVSIVH